MARCKEDALIGGALGEREQLVVWRRLRDVAVVRLQERPTHGVRALFPNVSRSVIVGPGKRALGLGAMAV